MTKFELLPNEILLLYFQFFDAIELFNSFDGLNHRFNQLIRQVPLQLNFRYIRKSIFDQFCTRLLTDDRLKSQIYSLKLSNHRIIKEIDQFLSKFSLGQFLYLQSLELNEINSKNVEKLKSMLPLLPNLNRLLLLNSKLNSLENIALPTLKILSVNSLGNFREISAITHLSLQTISDIELIENIFQYLPFLKYLRLGIIRELNNRFGNKDFSEANNLKYFICDVLAVNKFIELEEIFRYTPNLTNLIISNGRIIKLNADDVQNTIESLLSLLRVFKFNFISHHRNTLAMAKSIFEQFQTEFWHRQHQWFTECIVSSDETHIYTIPNPTDNYNLFMCFDRFSMNYINAFDNVRSLRLDPTEMNNKYQFYFSQIETLQLQGCGSKLQIIRNEDIERLKSMINFIHLKHLIIQDSISFKNVFDSIELFQQMSSISELTITEYLLASFLKCSHLCKCLQGRIRILNILKYGPCPHSIFDSKELLTKFQEVFDNLEIFTAVFGSFKYLFYLMKHFKSLSIINVFIRSKQNPENVIKQLENELTQCNTIYSLESTRLVRNIYETNVSIWF
mgnify:CR=1 FL=1